MVAAMKLPDPVGAIVKTLSAKGHEAYAVGGCVRDLLRGVKPRDWDVTTGAKPDEIQKIFPESFYENAFGTVGVKTGSDDETLAVVEVTTFRTEEAYSDKRHPDSVRFAEKLEDDLGRRDFTINAVALGADGRIVDPYGGRKDLAQKTIRTVGDPKKRFGEDALRLLRAARLAAELGFRVEPQTAEAVTQNAPLLRAISKERIRDELVKLLLADRAADGIRLLEELKLLRFAMPELKKGIGVTQNKHHVYTVFEHNVRALEYAARKKYTLEVRLASLLHDVGKPQAKRGEGPESTFWGHEVIGAKIAARMLERLRFPKKVAEKVVLLVRYHLFYYNVGEVTANSVRRLLRNVGPENIEDLVRVREADRIGSGVPKAVPYKLRHFKYMVEKVLKDPISTSMLALDGNDVMRILAIEPGPKVGLVLNALLGEVLEDPAKNTPTYLEKRIVEFGSQSAEELRRYLQVKEKKIQEEEEAMRRKYYV